MNAADPGWTPERTERFYKAYEEYAKLLRTWFVAYGVGGPVLFLTQSHIADRIAKSGQARAVIYLFLGGVAAQVVLAMLNKWVMWSIYAYSGSTTDRAKVRFRLADWISEQAWLDIVCDVATLALFGIATAKVLLMFT